MNLKYGHALDLLSAETDKFDLVATDPPYAFGGSGSEHALSATVAIVLRECAARLAKDRWMLVMCASSWRSTSYMVEAVRNVLEPVRIGTWCKPAVQTRVSTAGWAWASVNVILFRKGRPETASLSLPDWIEADIVKRGRRAELPAAVADWVVAPYAFPGGRMLDPFAGSGALCAAAERCGMQATGYEIIPENPP